MLKLDISKFVTSKKTKNNLRQISATPPESAQPAKALETWRSTNGIQEDPGGDTPHKMSSLSSYIATRFSYPKMTKKA